MPWSTLQNWSGRLRVKIRRAGFGLGWLARLAVQHRLAEMNFGVVGIHPQALGTSAQSSRKVAEHLVAAGGKKGFLTSLQLR